MTTRMTRFDPFQGVPRWNDALDRLFQDFCAAPAAAETALLAPPLDVAEDEASISISTELPGLEKKDIEVSVKDGVLSIRGEKRMEEERREAKHHRIERRYGAFYRALSLPDSVDPDRVEAAFRNGVLRLTLPKRPESKPRSVSIAD